MLTPYNEVAAVSDFTVVDFLDIFRRDTASALEFYHIQMNSKVILIVCKLFLNYVSVTSWLLYRWLYICINYLKGTSY